MERMRYPEIDIARGIAVIGMIVYHTAYDLAAFYGYGFDMTHGWWLVLERIIAITFLLLVGISFAISNDRAQQERRWRKYAVRGLFVFGCGMIVTIATYIMDPVTYVRFGVLHLIGVAIVILPLFGRRNVETCALRQAQDDTHVSTIIALSLAIAIIGIGVWSRHVIVDTYWLIPLGFLPGDFVTVDYFPLLPWFGVVLMGLVIGRGWYVDNRRWRTHMPALPSMTMVIWFGRHALIIYLVHQPVILGALAILKKWGFVIS